MGKRKIFTESILVYSGFSDTTIKAVFDKEKNGVRVNLLNGKEEQMSLYNTDNKVWFILYE